MTVYFQEKRIMVRMTMDELPKWVNLLLKLSNLSGKFQSFGSLDIHQKDNVWWSAVLSEEEVSRWDDFFREQKKEDPALFNS